ncbi:hypothetical protein IM697_37690 [Streptomyces ferrugineus]|uniref:Secreted protein n=1 Tax=Streptomyces ferrugineus TaxID=1413221 RepID=A0A7M2SHD3_9ACTN|nr:hypothetical protein [Streptomyces ferrugineus]QOV35724.1 hypothetical protein IM697_37690 [Streptomyces ferrugineus]
MTRRTRTHGIRILAPAVGLAAVAVLVAPAGSGAAATSGRHHFHATPVGTWQGTVEHAEGKGNVTLSFHANGVMCLSSGGGPEGGGQGKGAWKRTGANTFDYRVRERLFEGDGTTVGYVDVNQKARQSGRTFNSSGISRIYDANNTFLTEAEAKVKVTLVSARPAAC